LVVGVEGSAMNYSAHRRPKNQKGTEFPAALKCREQYRLGKPIVNAVDCQSDLTLLIESPLEQQSQTS
jgi:hypothetical protein